MKYEQKLTAYRNCQTVRGNALAVVLANDLKYLYIAMDAITLNEVACDVRRFKFATFCQFKYVLCES